MKTRLLELGMDVKELAMAVHCAQSTMHDTLNSPDAKHSSLVPAIHKVLGWDPPAEPEANPQIYSKDALEIAGMYDLLPESMKKTLRDQARAVLELVGKKPTDES